MAEHHRNFVQKMRKMRVYIVTTCRKCASFRGGSDVDIVGVTGSIPVTPTIQINHLAAGHILPARFTDPRNTEAA